LIEESILKKLREAVEKGDVQLAEQASRQAVEARLDPLEAVEGGLAQGLQLIGNLFGKGEAFLTDLVLAAEAMKAGMVVLRPELIKVKKERATLGKVVIGTVAGDIHDIGKSIVAAMLLANGFEIRDLGKDVPTLTFVDEVKQLRPGTLGLSALLTTTMPVMRQVIDALRTAALRDTVRVIVGGAPVTERDAVEFGADEYGSSGADAVIKVKKLAGW
jgi:trimethylamine corrinoid protein